MDSTKRNVSRKKIRKTTKRPESSTEHEWTKSQYQFNDGDDDGAENKRVPKIGLKAYRNYLKKLNRRMSLLKAKNRQYDADLRSCERDKHELTRLLKASQEARNSLELELDELNKLRMAELKKLADELEHVTREYSQIMHERDNVNKEIDALQEKLLKTEETFRAWSSSAHNTASNLLLYDTSHDAFYSKNTTPRTAQNPVMSSSPGCGQDELERIVAASTAKSNIRHNQFSMTGETQPKTNLNESMSMTIESAIADQNVLIKELESAKRRRDMAFQERDKVIKERESIRCLCNELRDQRDKAISEVAETLKECDELKKQHLLNLKHIRYLEEKLFEIEKNSWKDPRDDIVNKYPDNKKSLDIIENDEDDQESRILKIDFIIEEDEELGVEFSYECEETEEQVDRSILKIRNIFISNVRSKSSAFGKLKKNDRLVKINSVELVNINVDDFKTVIKNLSGNISFIVSRHFSTGLSNSLNRGAEPGDRLIRSKNNSSFLSSELYSSLTLNDRHGKKTPGHLIVDKSSSQLNLDNIVNLRKLIKEDEDDDDDDDNEDDDNSNHEDEMYQQVVKISKKKLKYVKFETGLYVSDVNRSHITATGLSEGDRILAVNDVTTKNKPISDILKLFDDDGIGRFDDDSTYELVVVKPQAKLNGIEKLADLSVSYDNDDEDEDDKDVQVDDENDRDDEDEDEDDDNDNNESSAPVVSSTAAQKVDFKIKNSKIQPLYGSNNID